MMLFLPFTVNEISLVYRVFTHFPYKRIMRTHIYGLYPHMRSFSNAYLRPFTNLLHIRGNSINPPTLSCLDVTMYYDLCTMCV